MRVNTVLLAGICALLAAQSVGMAIAYRQTRSAIQTAASQRGPQMQAAMEQASAATDAARRTLSTDGTVTMQRIATNCGAYDSCTGIFSSTGACNGQDQLAIQPVWESSDIEIRQVTASLVLDGALPQDGMVMVGNSIQTDIMAMQAGSGTSVTRLDPPFHLPAIVNDATHIDAHVWCTGAQHFHVWVLVYYTRAAAVPKTH